MRVESGSTSSPDDISIIQLFRSMIVAWKLIGGVTAIVTLAAVAFALKSPEIYEAKVLLVPVKEEKTSMSGLSHILKSTVMSGMSLPSSQKEQILATLESRKFLGWYIKENNLMPVLFEEEWDSKAEKWKIEPGGKAPTDELAFRAFSDLLDLSEDRKTGLITLSIFWKDPEVAAEWANDLVRRLNNELRRKAIEDSKKRIGYLEKELAKPLVKDMKEVLYSLRESEERKAMLANVNEEFALQVIDPAVVPEFRAKPNRRLIAVLGGVCGLVLGVFAFLIRDFLIRLRQSSA